MHYGIDISSNNPHPINYQAVATSLRAIGGGGQPFVIVKATQGTSYVNPYAKGDIEGFRAAGAAVAAYDFASSQGNAHAEAAFLQANADGAPVEIDWETGGPGTVGWAEQIRAASGPASMLYGSGSYLAADHVIPNNRKWLADPNGRPGIVSQPCVMHQFSWTGWSGIPMADPGNLDVNIFIGSELDFAAIFSVAAQFAGLHTPTPISFFTKDFQ